MARPRNHSPSYLKHNKSGRARLVWTDSNGIRREKLLPGRYGSKESLAAKARLELELATSPTRTAEPIEGLTVIELAAAYLDYARAYYVDEDRNPTREVGAVIKYALRPLDLFAELPAADFGPRSLEVVRRQMIADGLSRPTVNRRVNVIRRAFKWAASRELIPVATFEAP